MNSLDLISRPQVLWAAWLRVDAWYRTGNLAPQPELSIWKLHPEAEIRSLGQLLRSGEWQPSQWLRVPYPKKGMSLRHYWMPTVRDQVAFMAHMVLLGPLLDYPIHNFAFGNRWYRPIAWNRRADPAEWVLRPYPFLDKRTYRPYSRSHGLFRRVASWTVSRMVGAEIQRVDFSGPVQAPKDYPKRTLPECTRESWWPPRTSKSRPRAYWAALDLQLAYPSVRLQQLDEALKKMLSQDLDSFPRILSGYPDFVVQALRDPEVRLELACNVMCALRSIRDHETRIPPDAWRPCHATQRLPPDNQGLPTGLAISGLLLNVLLHSADRQILKYLRSQQGKSRGAFLRFADDMTVLSLSDSGLLSLIDEIWCAIEGSEDAVVAVQHSHSNLRLNVGKTGPDGVQEVLLQYLREHGWKKECKTCDAIYPCDDSKTLKTLYQWWQDHRQAADKGEPSLSEKLNRETVGPNELGPFATTLVERLSEIGRDTLVERFGRAAHHRLVQLHELARFDIDDKQVRPDTRRSFAVNRLVAAWLPVDAKTARKEIGEIRDSIDFVLQETPWKFALWRAAVRTAGQRPLLEDSKKSEKRADREDEKQAREWLSRVLGRIACHHQGTPGNGCHQPDVWAKTWPKVDFVQHRDRDPSWRSLYLSYHRAAFWQALANEIRNLRRHDDQVANSRVGRTVPSSRSWAVRAIPDGRFGKVADFLADLDRWVKVLYPNEHARRNLSSWPWELDQLVAAVLAAANRAELAEAWRHCKAPGDFLMVPESAICLALPETADLLRRCKRVQAIDMKTVKLSAHALAHVYLGSPDCSLSSVLFPDNGRSTIRASLGTTQIVMMGIALRCSDRIPTSYLSNIVTTPADVVREVAEDPLKLKEYGRARTVLMAREDGLGSRDSDDPTLHRLLWGLEPGQVPLKRWRPKPWEIPAVGLTVALAARLYDSVRREYVTRKWDPKEGPLTWSLRGNHELLAAARRLQFGEEIPEIDAELSNPVAIGSRSWETPPHPAYFLPFVSGAEAIEVNRNGFTLYCDVLLLLTAVDGGEDILHGLAMGGAGNVRFEDRWDWRSRIHLPREAWECVEKVVRWTESPTESLSDASCEIEVALGPLMMRRSLSLEDCYLERVDIRLEPLNDLEMVRAVNPRGAADTKLPEGLRLDREVLAENMLVRIGQVAQWPAMSSVVSQFPAMEPSVSRQIMEQVASAFQSESMPTSGQKPELVVLPEVCIPESEAGTIRKLVEVEGRASLAGLYWRELRPVYSAGRRSRAARCWLVNEAELVIPVGVDCPGPTGSRWFRVRKPLPAHVEVGLVRALSATMTSTQWNILRGQRWHRFLHPRWGDFTVAVCSDLLDAFPWRFLRGEILHLFMVAFNKDVGLYEALTWVRAYETYVNLVAVNHGQYGGSFLWTPRRSHGRELAQLRGKDLLLLADVEIPVKELAEAQVKGVADAVCIAECNWMGHQLQARKFKAPPPDYQRK